MTTPSDRIRPGKNFPVGGSQKKVTLPVSPSGGEAGGCCIPNCVTKLPAKYLCNPQLMLFLVLFFGVATQALMLGGGSSAQYVPYLGIISSPFYLVHAIRDSKKKLALAQAGAKVHRSAEVAFYALMALAAFGTALGDVTKPLSGGVQIAGLSQKGACALIFGHILPIVMVVTGSIGGLAATAQLWRSQSEMKKFKEKIKDPNFQEVANMLEFLRSPKVIKKGDAKAALLDERRKAHYFSSDHRRKGIEKELDEHNFTYICGIRESVVPQEIQKAKSKDPKDLLHEVQDLFKELLNDEHNDIGHLRRLDALHAKLADLVEKNVELFENASEFRKSLECQRHEIQELKQEIVGQSEEIYEKVRVEMHRKVMNHSIMLFLAALTIVGGILTITGVPAEQIVGSSLIIIGLTSGIGAMIFEKFVSEKKFLEMDKWLRKKVARVA